LIKIEEESQESWLERVGSFNFGWILIKILRDIIFLCRENKFEAFG